MRGTLEGSLSACNCRIERKFCVSSCRLALCFPALELVQRKSVHNDSAHHIPVLKYHTLQRLLDRTHARTHALVRVLQCHRHAHKSRRHILNIRIFSTLHHADYGSIRVSLAKHLLVEPTPVSSLQGKTAAQPGTHSGSLFIVLGSFTPSVEVFAEVGRRPERLPGP